MRVKLTVLESKCRSGYHKKGDVYYVDDKCPDMCMELFHNAYPYIFTLKNNGELDCGNTKKKEFDVYCPDSCLVKLHGEVVED